MNFLSKHNAQYKELDYKELTEQTADKCFSDLEKSPAGEISHYELLSWVCGKTFITKKREQILARYKPLPKATLIKNKIERKKQVLKRVLKNENLMSKLLHYRETTLLDKIHVYDAVEAFNACNKFGFLNRHDFGKVITELLVSHNLIDRKVVQVMHQKRSKAQLRIDPEEVKAIKDDPEMGNIMKSIDDTVNKIFRIFDRNQNGIVEIDEISVGCSLLCSGSIGDRVKVLFNLENDSDDTISYDELYRYFYSIFTINFEGRSDINLEVGIDKLAKATCQN